MALPREPERASSAGSGLRFDSTRFFPNPSLHGRALPAAHGHLDDRSHDKPGSASTAPSCGSSASSAQHGRSASLGCLENSVFPRPEISGYILKSTPQTPRKSCGFYLSGYENSLNYCFPKGGKGGGTPRAEGVRGEQGFRRSLGRFYEKTAIYRASFSVIANRCLSLRTSQVLSASSRFPSEAVANSVDGTIRYPACRTFLAASRNRQ
jgi:hypothetical protein